VRRQAGFACEYCGVEEADVGGELTVDHYQPVAYGGSDDVDNLVYSCARCNLYKADYWPLASDAPSLWHPRREARETHMLELADGTVHPLTPTGAFTISRLRLNRRPLVAYRLRKMRSAEERRLHTAIEDIAQLVGRLQVRLESLLDEQRRLLEEQRMLLDILLRRTFGEGQ
jgi:hypothetical protein